MNTNILTSTQAVGTYKATRGFLLLHSNLSPKEAKDVAEVAYTSVKHAMACGAMPSGTAVLIVDVTALEEIGQEAFNPMLHRHAVLQQYGAF